jgi:hypothetical protein
MKNSKIVSVVILLIISLLSFSCKKDRELDQDITSAEDQSQGEMSFDLVYSAVNESVEDLGLKKSPYPIVSIDSAQGIKTMKIDYGTVNYLCRDGQLRRGIIWVKWNGAYRNPGTLIEMSFENFYQNNMFIEGKKSIFNEGLNLMGHISFTIEVDGKITSPSAETFTWKSNRTRVWIAGDKTTNRLDDVYEISGTGSGINRKGISFQSTITQTLRVINSCEYKIVSGILEISPENKLVRTINFGSGNCDRLITVTVNGKTRTIERRK